MKRIFKFLVVPMLVVMLLMATVVPAFADHDGSPEDHPADTGLGTAAFVLIAAGVTEPTHPANEPTHAAACTITDNNPATTGEDPEDCLE